MTRLQDNPLGGNPFSTAKTTSLSYMFASREQQTEMEQLFAASRFRCQIVGPHGCGKSTLASHFAQAYASTFGCVRRITIRRKARLFSRVNVDSCFVNSRDSTKMAGDILLFIVDGIENLNYAHRRALIKNFQNRGCAFILTCHRTFTKTVPIIAQLPAGFDYSWMVLEELQSNSSVKISKHEAQKLYASGGSTRDLLFSAYDWFEKQHSSLHWLAISLPWADDFLRF